MNIIVSSWPAAGGSTLSLLLANLLGFEYVSAGYVFREIAQELFGEDPDANQMFEKAYGPAWDNIWELYIQQKAAESNNIVLEGKTAGFLIDGLNFFKVMVIADMETRKVRASLDKRKNLKYEVGQRDQEIGKRWKNELGIDIYDRSAIENTYDLVLDTTDMTVSEEMEIVIDGMRRSMKFEGIKFHELIDVIYQLDSDYASGGKDRLIQKLQHADKIYTTDKVFTDWQKLLPDLVEDLPKSFKKVVTK